MDPSVTFGINFFEDKDVSIRIGPLEITSINTIDEYWGSFEISIDGKGYLYCWYAEDVDPYRYATTGHGEPEWYIASIESKRTLWTSSRFLYPIWDWYRGIKKKFVLKK